MKKLRLRAILKSMGYKIEHRGSNDVIYYNKKLDSTIYHQLEVDTYYINIELYDRNRASKELFFYLEGNNKMFTVDD